ncbi:MAG: hypothetical protein HKN46_00365 [Acidimicrobiia bacterium]|nr:hypothetical protein [Acidimicrobiia bacterium]
MRLLREPASHEAFVGVLFDELDLLERLLFKSTELSLLVTHGALEHVTPAVEEVVRLEEELCEVEVVRAAIVDSLSRGDPTSLDSVARDAPGDLRDVIDFLGRELRLLTTEVGALLSDTRHELAELGHELSISTARGPG